MNLKLAWRNIWRNKRRTLITVASIFLAVILAVIMRSLQWGVYDGMINNVVSFYYGSVQIHQKGYWNEKSLDYSFEENDSLLKIVSTNENVKAAVPRLESFALASAGNLTRGTLVVGTSPSKEKDLTRVNTRISTGKYLDEDDDGALVAEGLAEHLKLKVNDTIVLLGQGYHGAMAAGKYPIRGLVHFGSPELNDGIVYLGLNTAQQLYSANNRLTSIALSVRKADEATKVALQIKSELNKYDYEVMNWKEMMPDLVQLIQADNSGGIIFIAVLYLIIAFGVFGTILMMIAERQHEFGILVAIGMKRFKLGFIVVLEIFLMAFIGAVMGALAAIPVISYFIHHPIHFSGDVAAAYVKFGIEPIFSFSGDPGIFISQAWVVFVISIVLSIYPIIRVSRLKSIEALKA